MALTKAMSRDLAADNIRVNTVCIGLIRSDQIEKMWRNNAPDLTWEEFSRDPRHDIPLGRIGETDEAARVITFPRFRCSFLRDRNICQHRWRQGSSAVKANKKTEAVFPLPSCFMPYFSSILHCDVSSSAIPPNDIVPKQEFGHSNAGFAYCTIFHTEPLPRGLL